MYPYSDPALEYVAIPLASFPELAAMIPGPRRARYAKRRYSDRLRRVRERNRSNLPASDLGENFIRSIVPTIAFDH